MRLAREPNSPQEIFWIIGVFPLRTEDNRIAYVGIDKDPARQLGDINSLARIAASDCILISTPLDGEYGYHVSA